VGPPARPAPHFPGRRTAGTNLVAVWLSRCQKCRKTALSATSFPFCNTFPGDDPLKPPPYLQQVCLSANRLSSTCARRQGRRLTTRGRGAEPRISWQFGVLVAVRCSRGQKCRRSALSATCFAFGHEIQSRHDRGRGVAGRGRVSGWRFGAVRVTSVAERLVCNSSPSQVTLSRPSLGLVPHVARPKRVPRRS
jgi:hypothetical protein